jgi:AraC-like DNA-binding protein
VKRLLSQHYFSPTFPLHITEVRQDAIAEHSHDFYEMIYVRRGHGTHFIEGKPFPIRAGDLYVISPREKHHYAPAGDDLRIVNVLWLPALVHDLLRADATLGHALELLYIEPVLRRGKRFSHHLHLSGSLAYRVEVLLDEMKREQASEAPGSHLLLRHLFCALLVLLSRAHQTQKASTSQPELSRASQQALVARAIEYIEVNHAASVKVGDVAAHVALSPSRLSHIFKQHMQRGIIEYLHEYRLSRICAGLLNSKAPVQEIAQEVGYGDLRFFHRVFRRHTGCNPTQYRQHFGSGS